MMEFFESIGRLVQSGLVATGRMAIMLYQAVMWFFVPPFKLRNIFKQMEFVGVKSMFVVVLTGSFTGMVLAYQSFHALKKFGAESLVGASVGLSMARELGPVLTALIVTGRVGSAMATELGTMKVTEQIDALSTMAVNPLKHLVVPRILAGILMLPFLTIIADFVGMLGGYFVGVKVLNINSGVFIGRTLDFVGTGDIFNGLIKAAIFGLILSLVACYQGFYTSGGAAGVGKAATSAVVLSSVLIFIADYFLTSMMFQNL